MSHLKDIIVELHNCLHEFEPEDEIPMVWSREFQQKLAQNATHWTDDQRRASHVSNMDFQDEEDAGIVIPYEDDYEYQGDSRFDAEMSLDATLDFDYEQEEISGKFKTKYGQAYRNWLFGSEEETNEPTGRGLDKIQGLLRSSSEEEEEEGDVKIGGNLNITDDPEKVAKAKRLRDRARKARDKAVEKREEAKAKQGEETGEDFGGEEDTGDEEWDDPDRQGVIRTVPNAHLVHKRQQEDGTFDELWIYNILDDFKKELKIRRAILAGTDIPINKMKSPDGSQTYELWTVGNAQMLKIQGLPN